MGDTRDHIEHISDKLGLWQFILFGAVVVQALIPDHATNSN